jgi:hypothetical protein
MTNTQQTHFFFYNNYKNNLLDISPNVRTHRGFIWVDLYNYNDNTLLLGNQKNQLLEGTVATFDMSLMDILVKLNTNKKYSLDKKYYKTELIDVDTNNGIVSCYIVY